MVLRVAAVTNATAYVWEFWDGSVETTTVPEIARAVNQPGEPLYFPGGGVNTRSSKLNYTVTAVSADGNTASTTGQIDVACPPSIAGASIRYAPSAVGVAGAMTGTIFSWRLGPSDGGGSGFMRGALYVNDVYAGTVTQVNSGGQDLKDVVWTGNGTRYSYPLFKAYTTGPMPFSGTVGSRVKLVVTTVTDFSPLVGTAIVEEIAYGAQEAPAGLPVTVEAEPVTDTSVTGAIQRIGPDRTVTLRAISSSATGETPTFTWTFDTSGGWTVPSVISDEGTRQPDGSYLSEVNKDTAGEVTQNGKAKYVTSQCSAATSAGQASINFTTELLQNDAPGRATVTVYDGTTEYAGSNMTALQVTQGAPLQWRVAVTDANSDVVSAQWSFACAGLPFATMLNAQRQSGEEASQPSLIYGFAPWINVPSGTLPDSGGTVKGQILSATVTVTDWLGAQSVTTVTGPSIK